ncbi:FixH family protein [Priestia taiwanensis]|uniref:YtkA-like domain-containing protein n=1 Tax=Priestia taiwanensis TaxID=1347902 RepID=A0A917EPR5_9BACI|nr:FixH family protein [Priestia taiwanensis]MBM7363879.1 hypothetical protein [Priestia taiwanensis]GGE69755.1 hypothetical protein GCM10007140_19720 [Priestia taiwanensis]
MKKFFIGIVMAMLAAVATGCTTSEQTSKKPEPVVASIFLPKDLALHEENVLKVQVTQGEEAVDDASEVQFEIWKGKEASELIMAKHEEGGVYYVKKTFKEDGIYFVKTHVSARGTHVMPTKLFTVGNVSEEEIKAIKEQFSQKEQSNHSHHH